MVFLCLKSIPAHTSRISLQPYPLHSSPTMNEFLPHLLLLLKLEVDSFEKVVEKSLSYSFEFRGEHLIWILEQFWPLHCTPVTISSALQVLLPVLIGLNHLPLLVDILWSPSTHGKSGTKDSSFILGQLLPPLQKRVAIAPLTSSCRGEPKTLEVSTSDTCLLYGSI